MSEADGLTFYDEDYERQVERWARAAGKSLAEVLEDESAFVLKGLIRVTPPFSGKGSVSKAKKQGERKISRDLNRLFVPVQLKGMRTITQVFGRPIDPVQVPTRERHPDVGSIYANAKKANQSGRGSHRFAKSKLYVDERKFRSIEKRQHKQVGYLGGGFGAAAMRLGVTLPAFMKRHAGRAPGSIRITSEENVLRVSMVNAVPYINRIGGMEKRVLFVLSRRKRALDSKIKRALRENEKLMN